MTALQGMEAGIIVEERVLEAAGECRRVLRGLPLEVRKLPHRPRRPWPAEGLDEEVIRAFGVGYAPIGHAELIDHLGGLGYSTGELVAAGLATRSVRGRPHARFRSRIMFPIRDREGRILGFAGLGTHLGPSWSLWVTSPGGGPYRPSEAVFGLDRAAAQVAALSSALVRRATA